MVKTEQEDGTGKLDRRDERCGLSAAKPFAGKKNKAAMPCEVHRRLEGE